MPMDELSRLTELFGDKMSVGELAIILARHDNNVQDAAWGILNGEKVDLEEDSFSSLGYDGACGKDNTGGRRNSDDGQRRRGRSMDADADDGGGLLEGFPSTPVGSESQPSPPSFQKHCRRATFSAGSTGRSVGAAEAAAAAAAAEEEEEGVVVDAQGRTTSSMDNTTSGSIRRRSADDSAIYSAASSHKISRDHQRQVANNHRENDARSSRVRDRTTPMSFIGSKLQRLNVARLIDQMEQDQEVADHLDFINRENAEEEERRRIVREANQRGLDLMRDHLEEFIRVNPRCTYERWIEELHPDNVQDKGLSQSMRLLTDVDSSWMEVDHRFYVKDSDHRRLWNQSLSDRDDGDRRAYVPARCSQAPGRKIVDLLGGGHHGDEAVNAEAIKEEEDAVDGVGGGGEGGRGGVSRDDDEDGGGGPAERAASAAGTDGRSRRSHPWQKKAKEKAKEKASLTNISTTTETETETAAATAPPATDQHHLIENLYSSDEDEEKNSKGGRLPPPSAALGEEEEEEEEIAFELPNSL